MFSLISQRVKFNCELNFPNCLRENQISSRIKKYMESFNCWWASVSNRCGIKFIRNICRHQDEDI